MSVCVSLCAVVCVIVCAFVRVVLRALAPFLRWVFGCVFALVLVCGGVTMRP